MTPSLDHRRISEIIVEPGGCLNQVGASSEIRIHAYPPLLEPTRHLIKNDKHGGKP